MVGGAGGGALVAEETIKPPVRARSSMNVEQFIADLDELVELVRKRLGKSKVTILGHSWGTALGVFYAARFPEKVDATRCGR
jgi:pimeloyl-ACP methyl ester carboxylesterase